jgi:hypothetical protein
MYKGAVQLFSRALNVSEAELFKMMEQGQLVSAEVLPKVAKEFKKSATEGGAYELALKGLRVTEGQFATSVQRSAKTIFNSGFEKGLSELYGTLSEIFKDNEEALAKLGATFGRVFKGIAHILRVIEPLLAAVVSNLELLTGGFMLASLSRLTVAFGGLGLAIRTAFLPITAAVAGLEEISSLFSDKLVGNIELAMGEQLNIKNMTQSKLYRKDGNLMSEQSRPMDLGILRDVVKLSHLGWEYSPPAYLAKTFFGSDTPKAQPAANVTQYIQIDAPSEDVAVDVLNGITNAARGR